MQVQQKDDLHKNISTQGDTDKEQKVLITSSTVSDENEARINAEKRGYDYIQLSETQLSPNTVRLLPQWLVTEYNVIAVKFEGDILYVAMVNPLDLPVLDHINLVTGLNVKPIVAAEREIIKAISQHYNAEQMTKQDMIDARFDKEQISRTEEVKDLVSTPGESNVVKLINSIIKDALDSVASDIHFEPSQKGMVVRFRVDGILHDCLTVPAEMKKEITSRIKVLARLDITEKRKAQDGHISLKYKGNDYDLRVSIVSTINGEKTVIRILDKNKMFTNLDTLGICSEEKALVEGVIERPYGMIIVTGPTGSGKTTTLYAMLCSINAVEKNIITVENPVEYELNRITQMQIDPNGCETFAEALRSILRQDPDVIMVGEIRDLETAEIAIQAALTGHLVLSTLHTNDAATAITRLRELGIPSFLISSCVVMVVAQRLVRKICSDCKESYQPDENILKLLGAESNLSKEYVHGRGCNYCFNSGFRSREGVYEILTIDHNIQNAILQDKSAVEIEKMAVEKGMKTMLDAAMLKVYQGKTCVEEIGRVIAPERS